MDIFVKLDRAFFLIKIHTGQYPENIFHPRKTILINPTLFTTHPEKRMSILAKERA